MTTLNMNFLTKKKNRRLSLNRNDLGRKKTNHIRKTKQFRRHFRPNQRTIRRENHIKIIKLQRLPPRVGRLFSRPCIHGKLQTSTFFAFIFHPMNRFLPNPSSVVSGPYQDKENSHQPSNSPSPNDGNGLQPTTDPLAITFPSEPIA